MMNNGDKNGLKGKHINVFQFRPQEAFCLEHRIPADGFPVHLPNRYHTVGAMHLD